MQCYKTLYTECYTLHTCKNPCLLPTHDSWVPSDAKELDDAVVEAQLDWQIRVRRLDCQKFVFRFRVSRVYRLNLVRVQHHGNSKVSLFAVDALCALGMLLLNVLLSLLGWTAAYPRRSRKLAGALVGLHLLASAATLLNSPQVSPANGCAVALPCLFASVAAAALLTVYTISTSLADFAIARPAQHPAPHTLR